MCLAVPCELVEREGPWGQVALGESKLRVRLDLLDEVSLGDYVLVHAGFAIERLDESEALETLRLLEEAGQLEAARGGERDAP